MVQLKFKLGQLVATRGVAEEFTQQEIIEVAMRHGTGDWGDLDNHDKKMNDNAVKTGEDRILSKHTIRGQSVYVITEWDRSVTTVLFPSEY